MELNATKEEVQMTDIKLNVPYFSQYKDIENGDHRVRACGMTSVYMVLKYFGAEVPSLDEMIEAGIREGGYGPSGWIHEYFVELFRGLGYECERKENLLDRDIEIFHSAIKQGNPVVVSAVRRLWDQRIFHMVVLTGVRETDGKLEGFFYHDPASLREEGSRHLYVALPTFFLDWRRMAVLPRRKET